MDGNPAFTVHATVHAFSAAINLKHYAIKLKYVKKYFNNNKGKHEFNSFMKERATRIIIRQRHTSY